MAPQLIRAGFSPSLNWEVIAKKSQDHRDATILSVQPPIPDISALPLDSSLVPKSLLTAEETSLTETDPASLVSKLASEELSAVQVTNAFRRRAGLAQKLVNCITELLPTALERAAFLDDYLKTNGKPIGPLHGLPISVKEHINMKGLTCNAGFVAWHDRVPDRNAHILDILLDAGAILYARTTQPQTLMHIETDSNFYGVTVNPFNRNLSAGGSSGGEGALVGLRGSCLGIGTDIGGSIRSPAANNGVYGLRPTSYRLPMEGLSATMLGQEQIVPVIGPITTSLAGVKLFMKTLIDAKPWIREPSLLPLPWRTEPQFPTLADGSKKLKIAIMWDDGVVQPHPPVTRALRVVADKLSAVEGVTLVDWTPYKHDWAWTIISSLYFCDGGSEEAAAIEASGEPWRPLSKFILKETGNVKKLGIRDMWDWTMKRDEYRAEYSKLWGNVDVILCPVAPWAAPLHDTAKYWCYTSQWNLLDYPALVAPVTKVDLAVDVVEQTYVPKNEKDKYCYDLCKWRMRAVGIDRYADIDKDNPENYANAPVSLQLVGRRYEDEKVIEAMEYIQEKIGSPFAKFY
ncbi:putative glutamyl-tRNA amidotransferase subunit A [Polyplosphaeria fusca]|uniref:amidase n=1 Tax=Polyplosphaeria fusca TaxID=682080 RepID=A0A9P4VAB8_9PLEO|nr:putative glutamyl-tRNA amidotransferase subunit A [Polyplosphaeria fusca]